MSYARYETEVFVIGRRSFGEADRRYLLLSREAGVIEASARSVRLARSKLRMMLEPFTPLTVSLVRGREVWRLVGVRETCATSLARPGVALLARLAALLRRLVHGELPDTLLYEAYARAYQVAEANPSRERCMREELLAGLWIVEILGHLSAEGHLFRQRVIAEGRHALSHEEERLGRFHLEAALRASGL